MSPLIGLIPLAIVRIPLWGAFILIIVAVAMTVYRKRRDRNR